MHGHREERVGSVPTSSAVYRWGKAEGSATSVLCPGGSRQSGTVHRMDTPRYISVLRLSGEDLASFAEGDLGRPVPSCPE